MVVNALHSLFLLFSSQDCVYITVYQHTVQVGTDHAISVFNFIDICMNTSKGENLLIFLVLALK